MSAPFESLHFQFGVNMFASKTGTQTVRVGKIELESVVPNSQPESLVNVRGQ